MPLHLVKPDQRTANGTSQQKEPKKMVSFRNPKPFNAAGFLKERFLMRQLEMQIVE